MDGHLKKHLRTNIPPNQNLNRLRPSQNSMRNQIDKHHIISQDKQLIEALSQINSLRNEPLVLFVVDEKNSMVGTLTDGDSRRALIAGASVSDPVSSIMNRHFRFVRESEKYDVRILRKEKENKMRLVPVLDEEHHIMDVINFEKQKTNLPLDGCIMAGGKGERLRPLTENTPKPLLAIGDKPIIDYNVDNMIRHGINHISVTVNYLHEQLEEHFKEERHGVAIKTILEPCYLGTIGSVQYIPHFFHDDILLMNSDLFTNIDIEDFYLHYLDHNADMSVASIPYSVSIPYGIFDLDGRDIKGIREKPSFNYYANGGIYLIRRKMIEKYLPKDTFYNVPEFMEQLIANGHRVIRYPLSGYWIDIGNKQDYTKAQEIVKHLNIT